MPNYNPKIFLRSTRVEPPGCLWSVSGLDRAQALTFYLASSGHRRRDYSTSRLYSLHNFHFALNLFFFTPSDAVRTSPPPHYPRPSNSSRGHGFITQNSDLIKCKLPQLTAMFLGEGKDLQKPSPTVDTTSCRCYAIYISRARRRSGLLARQNTVKPPPPAGITGQLEAEEGAISCF